MSGLYIHIPFRRASHPPDDPSSGSQNQGWASSFVAALCRELKHHARQEAFGDGFSAVYLGGGHPSLLPFDATQTFFEALTSELETRVVEEVTVEVSPADVSLRYLKELRRLGVTRLSVKARSLGSDDCTAVDAPHSVEETTPLIREVRTAGFQTFSVDLPFGGANHPLSHWKASLQRAVDLRVPHVALHEQDQASPPPDRKKKHADRLEFAMTFLTAKGYEQYELTHFARPGHRSRYQEHVYAHGDVLGLGPSAESFWWADRGPTTTAERWSNVTTPEAYVERLRNNEAPVAQRETIDRLSLVREYILLRLRTSKGLDLGVLSDQYDFSLRARRASTLDRLAAEGLIHDDPNRIRLTDRGRLLTDAITQRLLPASTDA